MERKEIQGSSNVKSIGYDPKNQILEIEYHGGRVYQYQPISKVGYKLLMSAESKGKFLNSHIKYNKAIKTDRVS